MYFNNGVFASAGNITSLTLKGAFHNDDKGSPFSGSSGNSALANAKFKTIDLSGMTGDVALCEYMFSRCTSATTITLPDGVSEILWQHDIHGHQCDGCIYSQRRAANNR